MSGNTLPLAPDARSLGKYEVLCRLSTGGMAEIFLASQRGLAGFRKLVVLKQILPDIRGEEEFVRMFLDEAKVTAAFNHPHIAQVYDLDIAEGELFLSMEFVPGATLVEVARACRQANHPIPLGFSLMAVRDTAVALHYAHTFTDPLGRPSPVIHRDVAEKNIMVTYEGVTKLLDFGIAKSLARASRTAVGMVKGTSGYMSPEQVLGEPLDARSDLFSLGVVLHECLTGMRLFYAKQAEAMMNAVLRCEVSPPSRTNKQVPPELDAIVLRALSKKREDRYASTLEFARALERAVGPLIWHPEQSSELMQRLFADRREQTRNLLMSGQAVAETTDGTGIQKLLALGSPSEQPTGVAGLPPPPARMPGSAPTVKAPVPTPAKAPTPPQGAPAVRRPTVTAAPVTVPAESDSVGTVRVVGGPLVPAPAPKRAPARTTSGETARPPPPPSEAVSPPPPPLSDLARTQPGRPALSPSEHTVRAQNPLREPATQPALPAEDAPPRRAATPPPPPLSDEPPRTRVARPNPTQDGMRAVPPPPPPVARDPQDGPRAAPPPPPPLPRDQQTAMIRMPVLPPEPEEDSVSVTPPTPRRGGAPRRRQPAPPPPPPMPVEPDATTHPVRAFDPEHPDRDTLPANLGDDDLHENTLRGIRAHPPPRQSRPWGWVSLTVLAVLGLGAGAVVLGLDGGRVSARLRPLLAQAGIGAKAPAPPANPPAVAPPRAPPVPDTVAVTQEPADAGTVLTETVAPPVDAEPAEPEEKPTVTAAEPRQSGGKKVRVLKRKEVTARKPASDEGTDESDSPEAAPAGEPGLLTLVTEPPSKVFLGGQELGDTPLFKVKLPPGKHVLKVFAVGGDGKALSLPLDIKSGETSAVRVPLELLSQQ